MKCMFYGIDWIYDLHLPNKIQTIIEDLIYEEESLEFLFYRMTQLNFLPTCLHILWMLKEKYPEYSLKIVAVIHEDETLSPQFYGENNVCMADEVRVLPKKEKTEIRYMRGIERKIMEQCNCILTYAYPQLHCPENLQIRVLQNQKVKKRKKRLIDLSYPDTAAFIVERYSDLKENYRIVMTGLHEGKTVKMLGEELGVTDSRIHQTAAAASKKLRDMLFVRMGVQRLAGR